MTKHRMYDINSASAIHLELLADIPRELADKIVAYRKKRKLIFYIYELYQIRGISRKYFGRLVSVFYATSNIVPGIGVKIQYVTGKQKHQNINASLKKRKIKIKKRENQRKIENRSRKGKLTREEICTQYKPLGYLNSTNLKRLDTVTHKNMAEKLGKKVQKKESKTLKNRKGKDRSTKRRKTTDIENASEYSESAPSTQRANINERVARLLKTAPIYEGDNVGMKEGKANIVKNRKKKYRSLKRRKTTDTENASEYSESVPSTRRANINERVARLLRLAPNYEDDNVEMEEGNIVKNRKRKNQCVKRPEIEDTEQSSDFTESTSSVVVEREYNDYEKTKGSQIDTDYTQNPR